MPHGQHQTYTTMYMPVSTLPTTPDDDRAAGDESRASQMESGDSQEGARAEGTRGWGKKGRALMLYTCITVTVCGLQYLIHHIIHEGRWRPPRVVARGGE
jgi:hypothetical protein